MNRYYSYLNSAKDILSLYNGQEPFASFLKKYFKQHKRFGSTDRKQVSHLCYCFFRLGKSGWDLPMEDKILAGLFLCSNTPNDILEALKPEWNSNVSGSPQEKCSMIDVHCSILNIFPWRQQLSDGIDYEMFNRSFLVQPDLFLRLRPGKEEVVKQKLETAGIIFSSPAPDSVAVSNAVKIEGLIQLNTEAVIQDLSSQRTGDLMLMISKDGLNRKLRAWDCCTASGGKSIMAIDILGNIELTVSDIRPGILHNLEKRFAESGITKYKSLVADLSTPGFRFPISDFDLVIADVPCTGSGTWGRTPENLFYFDVNEIERYSALQKRIVTNAMNQLKPGGYFLYVTCSVFKKENEEIVEGLLSKFPLEIKEMRIIKGYDKKADTMFAALLQQKL